MDQKLDKCDRLVAYSQNNENELERLFDPNDIYLPPGYKIEVYAQGLDVPSCMIFGEDGEIFIAETGFFSRAPKIIRLRDGVFDILAENFITPITGLAYREGNIFVSHKGTITAIRPDGTKENIIAGLPSNGDFSNSNVAFDLNGRIYFGQGTVTNSGVVGQDNQWIYQYPFAHDYPGTFIMVNGQNFESDNILVGSRETASTGAFSPFGVRNMPYEVKKGLIKASGSILSSYPDGSRLELVAWGLRNPARIKFDEEGRLYAANHGFDIRGSRPIANAPDDFHQIIPNIWYGWPDFAGGEPVTSSRFKPEGEAQPEFLLTNHPNIPPRPLAVFPPNSNIMGFDFNYDTAFGNYGDIYIAESGVPISTTYQPEIAYAGIGHRVSTIDITTGGVTTFAINKSGLPYYITGERGFGRPVDVVFGPDKALYVLDMGISVRNNPFDFLPFTGAIWRITKV